ncbi:VOC family protein [Pseudonocardia sp. KRD291]|uniref:VOC family protein n=1 Tax=Pseudonocardia sp. KRD291 TaxID=2792007 RepID=UPI001C4A2757|nr:VOC family protein [Pseudonocardia sp. KRD291]MBW0104312.1 VOC family protein [Pseudonocardia sp. KRD291]
MGIGRLGSVTLECSDPQELASFWAGLLGGEVLGSGQIAAVRAGEVWITAVRVADHHRSTWPDEPAGRHLDVAVEDLEVAQAEAVRLGATVGPQAAPDMFRSMRDPAGHPFCLSTQIPN